MKRTYYLVIKTSKSNGWKIRETANNLNTANGLITEIEQLEAEYNDTVIITYWKQINWWRNLWTRKSQAK